MKLTAFIFIVAVVVSSPAIGDAALQDVPSSSENVPPETKCVIDRVGRAAKLDESARLLAAEIADRCSELALPNEDAKCTNPSIKSRCEAIIQDSRNGITSALEQLAYKLLLILRQSPSTGDAQ